MNFLNPWAFLGLLSLPAIIALHWHFQRNSRVVVSSMFLWRFLDEKFQGNKMNFLHISWLLILDLLVALVLTLALTRPVLELPSFGAGIRQQVILLDDSASMLALEGSSNRFAEAIEVAAGIIEDSGDKGEVVLITFGGKAELVAQGVDEDFSAFASRVRQLQASGTGEDLRAALAIAQRLENPRLPQSVTIITDGAYPVPSLDGFPQEIEWSFVGDGDNNQAVLDLSVEGSRQAQVDLFFRLANYSRQPVTREVEVSVDGSQITSLALELPPNSLTPQTVAVTGGGESVSVQLLGTDQMPADDVAVVGTARDREVKVAIVANTPYPLDRAIETIPEASLDVFTPAGFLNNETYDLVIFRDFVPPVWPSGITLIFDPPPISSVISVGDLIAVQSQAEVLPGSILIGAGMESVRWEFGYDLSDVQNFEPLAEADNIPLVLHQKTGQSDIYLFALLLEAGNFTKHPAFPILLSRFVSQARDFAPQPGYLAGDVLILPDGETSIQTPSGELISGEETGKINLVEPGLYRYLAADNFGGIHEVLFGVNLGEADESDITPQDWRAGVAVFTPEDGGWQRVEVHLGPWLLAIAIILLMVEAWRAWR
ncbi:MAG: BatA and WFA domain-containing protein [Anaerolineales bacterium]|nr:BatA and WFA domain-containing protein [Anaerolineales bacterium]